MYYMNRSIFQIWRQNKINLSSKQTYNVYFKYKEMTTFTFVPPKNHDDIVLKAMNSKLKDHTNAKFELFDSLND